MPRIGLRGNLSSGQQIATARNLICSDEASCAVGSAACFGAERLHDAEQSGAIIIVLPSGEGQMNSRKLCGLLLLLALCATSGTAVIAVDVNSYCERAKALIESQNYTGALASVNEAIKVNPNYARCYNQRSVCYNNLGRYNDALKDLAMAHQLDPSYSFAKQHGGNLAWYFRNMADAYLGLNQKDSCLAMWDEAVKVNPKDAEIFYNRGVALGEMGENSKAIQSYSSAILLSPNNGVYYYNRGFRYEKSGDRNQAIADFTKSIACSPTFVRPLINRANCFRRIGQHDKAIADCNRALEIEPNFPKAFYNRGNNYYDLKKYEQALADYSQAIKSDPDYAVAYHSRGNTYRAMGNQAAAQNDWQQAARLGYSARR